MRIRVIFAKTEAMRFTGHLDLQRTWERTIRRAGLPLSYSQGFHPQPRIQLASALPLGFTSFFEIVDIWLEEDLSIDSCIDQLQHALPPGLQLIDLKQVDPKAPSAQTQVQYSEFVATLTKDVTDIDLRLDELLQAHNLVRERRGKSYDLRPLIQTLIRLPEDPEQKIRLQMCLSAGEGATGRPEEVLSALGIPPHEARIVRTNILLIE